MPAMSKLQLPFGPGNKLIMDKLPMGGDPLNINKMFNPDAPTPAAPPGPSAASIKLAADSAKRAARLAETVPTAQRGTTLLSAKNGSRLGS